MRSSATARYIHRNPLAFVPKSALGAYRWSSLPVVLGRRTAPPWLQLGVVRSVSEHADDHLRFVVTDLPSDGTVGADGRIRAVTLDDVVAVVASVGGCQPAEISACRGGDPARLRMITVTIALGERVADSLGLASELGLDPQSVRRIAQRRTRRLADDPSFSRLIRQFVRRLPISSAVGRPPQPEPLSVSFGVGAETNRRGFSCRTRRRPGAWRPCTVFSMQAGDRHRAGAARHRCDPAGHLADRVVVDVADDAGLGALTARRR